MFFASRIALTLVVFALCFGMLSGPVLADAAARRAAHEQASQVILNTHLFTQNRGMHIVPGIFSLYELIARPEIPEELTSSVKHIFGFNVQKNRAIGLFNVQVKDTKVGVLGCVGCHSGQAAGRFFVGLGNKNIDVGAVGYGAQKFSKPYHWTRHLRPEYQRDLIDQAMYFTKILANPNYYNLTQGMVPVSNVWQWFYTQAGLAPPEKPNRGAVKVLHLWGYGEKRKAGLFCDGFGDGHKAGWAAAVEMTAGQKPEVIRSYYDKIEALEHEFEKLLPPAYPFAIDAARAKSGAAVFAQNCASCHGTYEKDADGLPVYQQPNFIPYDVVGTDRDRLDTVSDQFKKLVETSPLSDIIKHGDKPPGYFAPRLDGIWARFGYLHNMAAPTVRALLTPPAERPRVWSLRDSGEGYRFDPTRLGLTTPGRGSAEERELLERARKGARDIYFVDRIGHSNQGHPFGTTLPEADKTALIEYLKTL